MSETARTVRQTPVFKAWIAGLRDREGRGRILERIRRVQLGQFGDTKSVGDGVSELRFSFGPGYRVYYTVRGATVVILLAGGDKGSQERDIRRAKKLAEEV